MSLRHNHHITYSIKVKSNFGCLPGLFNSITYKLLKFFRVRSLSFSKLRISLVGLELKELSKFLYIHSEFRKIQENDTKLSRGKL
ncbi:hypothetical protein BLOT_012246 [Blomia tropicalis]|nr:hypothetical protein BLOT_012246 [Blomia tropicalis]